VKLLPGFVLRRLSSARVREPERHARGGLAKWHRHHLRAALWLLAAFAVSQLLLSAWVERTPDVRDPEYVILRDRLRARIAERPGKPVVVFLGSSRVMYGFDPEFAGDDSTALFNFGVAGGGSFIQGVFYDRLTADGIRPDVLFVEVMPAFYNSAGVRMLDTSMLDGARLTAGECSDLLGSAERPNGPLRRWAQARALPIHRHQAELRDRTGLDAPRGGATPGWLRHGIGPSGFRAKSPALAERAELTALAHKQYDPFYTDFRLAEKMYARLLATIRRAQDNGVRVVLVVMPEGTEFRRLYSPAATAGVDALLKRLREETGAPLVDTRDWLPDDAFYDQHHTTPEGAAAFGTRFRHDVLPLAFSRSPN
jgi:hypothetical protein